jgi:predicted O-methyltransferase YrrM
MSDRLSEILKQVSGVKGILPGAQTGDIIKAALSAGPGPRLEIGALCGLSTCCISLASAENDMLLVVDPFEVQHLSAMAKDVVAVVSGRQALESPSFLLSWEKQVQSVCAGRRIIPVIGDRLAVLPTVEKHLAGRKLSFLFLDGLHSYEDVEKDITAYLPYVATGGLVVFHDYEHGEVFGVARAVDESVAAGVLSVVTDAYVLVARKT